MAGNCGGNKKVRVRRCIWTNGTTTPVFVPLARIDSNAIANVKVSYDLDEKTGTQLQVRRAKRGSNDSVIWGVATEFGAAYSGSIGWSYATAYELADVANEFNEFGVNVKNGTAGAIEFAWVTVEIELRAP